MKKVTIFLVMIFLVSSLIGVIPANAQILSENVPHLSSYVEDITTLEI